jgi:Zn finger protein HypA/HybF involved in hydrogenase expression
MIRVEAYCEKCKKKLSVVYKIDKKHNVSHYRVTRGFLQTKHEGVYRCPKCHAKVSIKILE